MPSGDYVNHPNYSPAQIPGSPPPFYRGGFGIQANPIVLSTANMMTIYGGGSVDAEVDDQITGSLQCQGEGPFPLQQSFLITPEYTTEANVFNEILLGDTAAELSSDDFGNTTSIFWNGYWGTDTSTVLPGLITVPVDSKTGIAAVSFKAHYSLVCSSGGDGGGSYANCLEGFDAVPDNRTLSITSGTNAKSPVIDYSPQSPQNPYWPGVADQYGNMQWQPGSEVVNADGSTNGDIGLPLQGDLITDADFQALPLGNWTVVGSKYNWFDSHRQLGSSGTLKGGDTIPTFTVGYDNPEADVQDPNILPDTGDLGLTDHIHLSYTDGTGSDGAVATANLYMHCHPTVFSYAINSPYPNGPNATTMVNFPNPGVWASGYPGLDSSGDVGYSAYYAVYGDIASLGTGLADIGTLLTPIPDLDVVGAVLAAAGIGLNLIGNDQQETKKGVVVDDHWPGASAATGTDVDQWAGGIVPSGVSSTAGSGPWDYTAIPMVCQNYANYLYAVDQWGVSGYASYGEKVVGVPIADSMRVYLIWSYKAQLPPAGGNS
jgi:hypothetical protein